MTNKKKKRLHINILKRTNSAVRKKVITHLEDLPSQESDPQMLSYWWYDLPVPVIYEVIRKIDKHDQNLLKLPLTIIYEMIVRKKDESYIVSLSLESQQILQKIGVLVEAFPSRKMKVSSHFINF